MKVQVELYQHLPSLVLGEMDSFDLTDGRLIIPSYELISRLDPYNINKLNCEKSRPVFYHMVVDCDESQKDFWIQSHETAVKDIHLALSLTSSSYLPVPTQSMCYLRVDTKMYVKAGVFQREWMFYGNFWRSVYSADMLHNTNKIFNYLVDFHTIKLFEPLKRAIDVLNEISNVEFSYKGIGYEHDCIDYKFGFVRMIQLIESILCGYNRRFKLGITVSFGLYWSLLLQPEANKVTETAEELSSLYKLRCKIIHGESHVDFESSENRTKYMHCRALFTATIKLLMILCKEKYSFFGKNEYLPDKEGYTGIGSNALSSFFEEMVSINRNTYALNEKPYNEFHQFINEQWKKIFS